MSEAAPTHIGELAPAFEHADIRNLVENKKKSRRIASRIYLLTLGRALDNFQRRHFRGKFDEFEIEDIQSKMGISSPNSVTRYADEMVDAGFLEDIGNGNRKYSITKKGKRMHEAYCLALKITGYNYFYHGKRILNSAEIIEEVESWKFDTEKMSDEAKKTIKETHEDWDFTSQIMTEIFKEASELADLNGTIQELQRYLQQYRFLGMLDIEELPEEDEEAVEKFQEIMMPEEFWEDLELLIGDQRKIEPVDAEVPGKADKSVFTMDVSEKLRMEGYSKEEAEKIEEDLKGQTRDQRAREIKESVGLTKTEKVYQCPDCGNILHPMRDEELEEEN
ncbi:MAG: hypothetical protein ABEK04_03105 [Candidatus Nanohalobium sp.]